jgi:hypothetical protein
MQYFPIDDDLMQWAFGADIRAGHIKSPFDIRDVWPSSYSSNTNEILWGAKVAARIPWIACVIRMSSYECGMDQPTYTPVQQIIERSGTLFFSFQDLDSTKPSGSVKIRVETITHYLSKYAADIIARKKAAMPPRCPLLSSGGGRHRVMTVGQAVCRIALIAFVYMATGACAPATDSAETLSGVGHTGGIGPPALIGRWDGDIAPSQHTIRQGLEGLWGGAGVKRVLFIEQVRIRDGHMAAIAWYGSDPGSTPVSLLHMNGALHQMSVNIDPRLLISFDTGNLDANAEVTARLHGPCDLVGKRILPLGAVPDRERPMRFRKAGCRPGVASRVAGDLVGTWRGHLHLRGDSAPPGRTLIVRSVAVEEEKGAAEAEYGYTGRTLATTRLDVEIIDGVVKVQFTTGANAIVTLALDGASSLVGSWWYRGRGFVPLTLEKTP